MTPEEKEAVERMEQRATEFACKYEGSLPMFTFYDGPEYELNCPRCGGRHRFSGPREMAEANISCGFCHHKFVGRDQVIVRMK